MDLSFWLPFLGISLALLAVLALFYWFKHNQPQQKTATQHYVQGLKFMAENDKRRALEKFKEAVREDSANVDAYLKLGDILREQGLINNAIRIHKELTLRGSLTRDEKLRVWWSLGRDYWKAGKYEQAAQYMEKLLDSDDLLPRVLPYLIHAYERIARYDKAYDLIKNNALHKEEKYKKRLALHKVLMGLEKMQQNEGKEARLLFKEAIKWYPAFVAPYLYMGDSYLAEERTEDAILVWSEYCQNYPASAHVLFSRLEKALFEQGAFNKIEQLYSTILKSDPGNTWALLALMEIYRKKGEYDSALELLKDLQHPDMDEQLLKAEQALVLLDKGDQKKGVQQASQVIEQCVSGNHQFTCDECGYQSSKPFWKCPKCGKLIINF